MSKRLQSLREKQAQTVEKMDALVKAAEEAKRELTAEEKTQFDAFDAEVDTINGDIDREEKLQARKAALARTIPTSEKPKVEAASRLRHGKLKNFRGEGAVENAYKSGMWILGAIYGNENAKNFCRENGIPIVKAASEGVNQDGGFLVPTEFGQTIIDLRDEYGMLRGEVRTWPMASDGTTIPRRVGGLTAYPMNENGTVTESQKAWDQVTLNAKKWGVLTRYSTELAEDAVIAIADDLAGEVAQAFAIAEDNAGLNGDGTSAYHGIVGVLTKIITAPHTASAIDAASGHDIFAEIDATDLSTLMGSLPLYALRNAAWYCSPTCYQIVFSRLMQAAGGNTKTDMSQRSPYSYDGYPIIMSPSMPSSKGDLSNLPMLLFGDLRKAVTMGTRRDITLKTSTDRYFEYDQVGILGTERFDINVHDLGSTTAAGPVVALIGE